MGYVIVFLVIAAFAGIVFVIAKKDAKERDEMVSKLTEDEKKYLESAEVKFVEKNAWVQDALVAKITEKGNKYDLRLLWYNTVLNNNEGGTITIADTNITKKEKEEHNIEVGSRVKMYFAPEKTVGSVKVVFDK